MIPCRIQPPQVKLNHIGQKVQRLVIAKVEGGKDLFYPFKTEITDQGVVDNQVRVIPVGEFIVKDWVKCCKNNRQNK